MLYFPTVDLDEPTQKDCPIGKTYLVLAIIAGSLLAVVFIVIAIICICSFIYKAYRKYLRYKKCQNMTDGEIERIEEDYKELLNTLKNIDPKKNKALVKEIKKALALCRGRLMGEGPDTSSSAETLNSNTHA